MELSPIYDLMRRSQAVCPTMSIPVKRFLTLSVPGQGSLIAVAVTILIALVLASSSLTGLQQMNVVRSVVTKQTLQTYYTAQAGIHEALATRMLPRSNYYNLVTPAAPASAYFSRSGRVYTDPVNRTGLVGIYRYVVVGGDSARQPDGSYYPVNSLNVAGVPRLLATDHISENSPFIVLSMGTTCKTTSGKATVGVDQISVNAATGQPVCNAGFVRDDLVLVTQVKLMRESTVANPLRDRADRMQVFKDSTQVRLPANAFVPGYGWTNTTTNINFDAVWAQTAAANGPLRLNRVVFYNFSDNTVYADQPVAGPVTNVAAPIPSKAVIRLYFDGPIDYRSISPTYNRQLTDCQGAGAANCRIRVMQNPLGPPLGGTAYTGNTTIPLFPGSTQVILLPPLTNTLNGATPQAVRVDATRMRSFSGAPGPADYTINFVTQ